MMDEEITGAIQQVISDCSFVINFAEAVIELGENVKPSPEICKKRFVEAREIALGSIETLKKLLEDEK